MFDVYLGSSSIDLLNSDYVYIQFSLRCVPTRRGEIGEILDTID